MASDAAWSIHSLLTRLATFRIGEVISFPQVRTKVIVA